MKVVLVTGANGFIGRHTLSSLAKHNFKVHACFSKAIPLTDQHKIIWHPINLLDDQEIENLLIKIQPTHLLHLAWYTKPEDYRTSPKNFAWLNSSLTLLNRFIDQGGKRAVLAGTCFEYDSQYGYCREFLTPFAPQSIYGMAKYSLYLLSEMLAKQKAFSLAWARIFYLFGMHEYPQRLLPAAISSFIKKKPFKIMNGDQARDFMYVADVADALVALLDSDVQGPVNIASGKAIKIGDLIAKVAEKLNANNYIDYNKVETNPSLKDDSMLMGDVTRLVTEVNWQPQHKLDDALDKTIDWWREFI